MKKRAIVLLAFTVALTAVSCQKENITGQNESSPLTVSAVSKGLDTPTKTELAFKYDVLWSDKDKIYVKDASGNHDTFTLQNGTGTTKGTFKQDGEVKFTGEIQAYYPATMLDGGSPVWPASQADDQTIPMYCKKTLSGATEERMDFSSLGSVLQLTFSTTSSDIVLKSIEVKADQAMSGAFTVENGQAKVSQPEGDKPGITLDLGDEGVKVGVTAKKFNIAVPAGEYNNLTITFIAKDGQKCPIHATKAQNLVFNTVNTLAVSGEFKYYVESISLDKSAVELKAGDNITLVATVLPDNATDKSVSWSSNNTGVAAVDETGKVTAIAVGTATITATTTDGGKTATCAVTVKGLPAGALKGVFSVSATKKVYFSQGNLWYGTVGDAQTATFNFEANQYSSASSWEASHVSHFYWSQSVNSAIAEEFDWNGDIDDVFFTNATETTAKEGFTVNVDGKEQSGWRTLSTNEWKYLFNNHSKKWVSVHGVNGYVIAPDGFSGELADTYADDAALAANNLVFLPAAGYRNGPSVSDVDDSGYYWSSTAIDEYNADYVLFDCFNVSSDDCNSRGLGYSVRLITE